MRLRRGQSPRQPFLDSIRAYLDWTMFGELPIPLWEMPPRMATEVRYLASHLPKMSPLNRGLG